MYFVNTQPSLIYIETAYLMQIDHNYYRRPLAMLLNTHMSENVFPSQIFFGFLLTESYLHSSQLLVFISENRSNMK